MIKNRKKIPCILIIVLLIGVLVGWIAWSNKALVATKYTVLSPDLPAAFSGFRIAQISDLHNDKFGKDNENLVAMLQELKPDIIAITGDLIDYYDTDMDVSLSFVEKIIQIAPCYYVPGNHEAKIDHYDQFRFELKQLGVCVLENKSAILERDGETITLLGAKDPAFLSKIFFPDKRKKTTLEDDIIMDLILRQICKNEAGYQMLLSHRPDQIGVYAKYNIDLVLSGHKHGAQFRLPYLGGLFTPSDGFFPAYDAGVYHQDDTTMIVSRGLGNSTFPFRINNRPEVVLIELQTE